MDIDILKHFVRKDVEILVGGIVFEGHMLPIAKGIVVLMPFPEAASFYGPASCKAEAIQLIRQVKRNSPNEANVVPSATPPAPVRSSLETLSPKFRFENKIQ